MKMITPEEKKPIHVKPSLYAFYFETLKAKALEYGYNLVLHGSMSRDLDLIAIAWQPQVKDHRAMVEEFSEILGGYLQAESDEQMKERGANVHGRLWYVIHIRRGETDFGQGIWKDHEYFLDISVIPPPFGNPQSSVTNQTRV